MANNRNRPPALKLRPGCAVVRPIEQTEASRQKTRSIRLGSVARAVDRARQISRVVATSSSRMTWYTAIMNRVRSSNLSFPRRQQVARPDVLSKSETRVVVNACSRWRRAEQSVEYKPT
jgi:hypothetical protein